MSRSYIDIVSKTFFPIQYKNTSHKAKQTPIQGQE